MLFLLLSDLTEIHRNEKLMTFDSEITQVFIWYLIFHFVSFLLMIQE